MKKKKALLIVCAVIMMLGAAGATLAWLNDSAVVANTFTVGNLDITLNEQFENESKLYPGAVIPKIPAVTVEQGSEQCYVFLEIDSDIAAISSLDLSASWRAEVITPSRTMYVYVGSTPNPVVVDASAASVILPAIFTQVSVNENTTKEQLAALEDPQIIVRAYAHQSSAVSYNDAKAAAIAWFDAQQ